MQRFAALLDALSTAPQRSAKLRLIGDHLATTPDPDRGLALAALTGGLDLPAVKPALVRALAEARVDPVLFRLSYDYVGDLAETVSLLWPGPVRGEPPSLAEAVERLRAATRATAPQVLAGLLDRLDPSGRFALLKLATGALRVGAGARLARVALAERFGLPVAEVEEVWHGLAPPYEALFAWAEGRGPWPEAGPGAGFRPFMLAHPLEAPAALDLAAHAIEWKWDGIRAQAVSAPGERRLFSRDGNDISAAFPDLVAALPDTPLALDGELLVRSPDGTPAGFHALQQRLNRKAPDARLLRELPVFLRAYDLLAEGGADLRPLPWAARRARLERVIACLPPDRFDLSPLVPVADHAALAEARARPPHASIEGVMLKRRDAPYLAGRVTGLWWKWKKDPLTADCVLMYAQRGHGRRSSFYSDFTFGAWGPDGTLLPVGKAYFGFTDEELAWLDRWVREHTVARFGPVREVEKALVLEVAFEGVAASARHRSGIALRFPRIARIRADKPAAEADTVERIAALARP
ncbi:cisplatin damage response ATP-dependent DNA ligase [Thermaurantiacus tibetensis]|uniref:cisplatin damage response ATP-dependent DNA ligase n=1 Tax=Thermaurantiacus tibetensis TaxID=2759035 RepID=UPI00188F44CD|nr:cisplatin damage response ATP-dependent DNA ligase [Thermaurantiacus tibetensis]